MCFETHTPSPMLVLEIEPWSSGRAASTFKIKAVFETGSQSVAKAIPLCFHFPSSGFTGVDLPPLTPTCGADNQSQNL